ncbi:MAG: DEAD/SNF2-like helicase [Edafosvirus sp.]|uniref:DEAD/SNF2-like helicase n=1 Tax=Edafosvirus sp. TaxID=2487765 RepID=A0A3G4ZU22_9VIRU|nr:MAG: DEAD/SNF2-like helicase [Edafosvirus sp.]
MVYNNLNEQSPKILQPVDLKIELREHQKTIVHAMKQLENTTNIEAKQIIHYNDSLSNFILETSVAILGDKVGAGKSLMIISLILEQKQPPYREQIFEGYPFLLIKSCSNYEKFKTNLLIVPNKIVTQWTKFFENAPILKIYVCSGTMKDINELDIKDLDNYDVVIVGCSKYKEFNEKFQNVKWGRIIIDEADTIKLPKTASFITSFLWLVTGTPTGLMYDNKTSITKIFKGLKSWIFDYLLVKNDIQYLEKSILLPVPKRFVIKCLTPVEIKIITNIIPASVMNMINAGNTDDAIKTLNCNVDTDENILQVITKNIQEAIKNKKIDLEAEEKKKQNSKIENKKIKQIEKAIERLNIRYNSIKEKIYDLNNHYCPICMGEFNKPVLLNCCKNLFCFECILLSINKSQNKCPYCRQIIYKSDLHIISKNDKELKEKKKKELKDKLDVLMEIIGAKKDAKVMIFAAYMETFKKIEKKLVEDDISYRILKGTSKAVNKSIDDFASGKIKVLMLNSEYFGAGMNLQCATDLIIYHRFSRELEEQLIGRGQRMGRTTPLNIYYLLHENENNYLDNKDKFEDIDYFDWLEQQEEQKEKN